MKRSQGSSEWRRLCRQDPSTDLLTVNGEFTASIVMVRCQETAAGSLRWQIRFDVGLWPDITVAVRMDRPNKTALDYYLLPRIDMNMPTLRLAEDNGISLDAYRFETLDAFSAWRHESSLGGCMTDPQTPRQCEMIPIDRINVINPRVRNKKIFKEIVSNIAELGLKRPITVTRRERPGRSRDTISSAGKVDLRPIKPWANRRSPRSSSRPIPKTAWS